MHVFSLQEQKKELQQLSKPELEAICLRFARFKKDNKELLEYVLFHQSDPQAYADALKKELKEVFTTLNGANYSDAKKLRKITKSLNKHGKYLQSPAIEADLWVWFCYAYCNSIAAKSTAQVIRNFFVKALLKVEKFQSKLHEDLAFDIQQELEKVSLLAVKNLHWYAS
ncbi:MAG: hypothetical protein ACKOWL_02130 [Sphingobacteriaceae bacterium]